MKKSKKPSKLMASLLETAKDFRDSGIMDKRTYAKITKRNLVDEPKCSLSSVTMLTAKEISALREESNPDRPQRPVRKKGKTIPESKAIFRQHRPETGLWPAD
ncbi:MAG TPA: hypothetical protein VKS24_21230 [Bradyrhizobium sp.]|nr:hypothetical protein [Bradyrhizobium sp.]